MELNDPNRWPSHAVDTAVLHNGHRMSWLHIRNEKPATNAAQPFVN
jgi:hypothetical protein